MPPTAIERSRAQFLGGYTCRHVACLGLDAANLQARNRRCDFPSHLKTAEQVAASPYVPAPHFLFFGSVATLLVIFPRLTSTAAGLIVISSIHVLTVLVKEACKHIIYSRALP